jgi:hypothetical protein
MSIGLILQYATLLWILISGVSVAVAFLIHREQVKTEIFLALSSRYDELLQSASTDFWLGTPFGTVLPERNDCVAILALRFCTLVSLGYYLFREHRIPKRMWLLLLRSAERRMRTPLFVREWQHLRFEFESFPEFVELVTSVQCGTKK